MTAVGGRDMSPADGAAQGTPSLSGAAAPAPDPVSSRVGGNTHPDWMVDAVAAELAAQQGSRVFDEHDQYPNSIYRRMYRERAWQILDVLAREGALHRNESGQPSPADR